MIRPGQTRPVCVRSRYEGHSLCFAIWFFNSTYNHSVYSSCSKNPPSACTQLTNLSNQLSRTPDHADWGMSKMTPSKNARASSAFWNCFLFSCHLSEGNKNQSQGAKSGEYGGLVTRWTSLAARKSRFTTAVCVLAFSWWSSTPRTPVRGRHLHHALKTLGKQWLTYQSSITIFLSSSGMVATWPNFAKKCAIICLQALLFLLNFTGGFSCGKTHTADCCFVSGSCLYEGHSLCFAIWFFNNTYNTLSIPVFRRNPPQPVHIFSNQLSRTPDHADWGMSKMTPSKNARVASAFWNCFPFSYLLTGGNKNQSQGAKSGAYGGWVTGWTSLAAIYSYCVRAGIFMMEQQATDTRSGTPFTPCLEDFKKQQLTYQSVVTVFLSSSGMVATWPSFAKKHAIICLQALLFPLNFTGGFSCGKIHTADCCFV